VVGEVARHSWGVAEREVARHEARRGRRHAYGPAEAARTALVVVDVVAFFADESPYVRGIIPTIDEAARALRAAGGLVVWVVPQVGPPSPWQVDFYGPEVAARYAASGGAGTPVERLAGGLAATSDDLVVEKRLASALFPTSSALATELDRRGIRRVWIAGTVTSVCCESTARDAAALGYEVVVLGDACADVNDDAHNASLRTVYRSFGDVRSAVDVVAELTSVL
jgi:nicotinamidase-related amidase